MNRGRMSGRAGGALAVLVLVGTFWFASRPAQPQTGYVGVQNCATSQCHQKSTRPGAPAAYPSWQKDPHATAFDGGMSGKGLRSGLLGDRAAAIAKKMGLGDPSREKLCLSCHAGSVQPDHSAIPLKLPLHGSAGSIEDGVQCESCHGPGAAWIRVHQRDHTAAVSAGMFDLLAPGNAGQQCLACHKVIDPKLVLAGHPDQSRFNFGTYAASIKHWGGHFDQDGKYIPYGQDQ